MSGRARWIPGLCLALLATPLLAGSAQAAPGSVVPGSDPAALTLLADAVHAETNLTYGGEEVVSDPDDASGEADQVVDVSHMPGQGTVMLTTRGTEGTKAGFLGADARRPQLLVTLLQRSYRVVLGGTGSVAGRAAQVVLVQRPDGPVAARFYVDTTTGLLLRRDLVDGSGRTTASLAFSRVSLAGDPVAFLPPLLPAVRTASLDDRTVDAWAARGWPCAHSVGGLTLFDARTLVHGDGEVMHLTYSDGLSTVSVFAQQGRLDEAAVPGGRRAVVSGQAVLVVPGHPRQLMWTADGYVLTVVADSDHEVVAAVVADLPHAAAPSGWSRVEHGLSRVVSWIDPFD